MTDTPTNPPNNTDDDACDCVHFEFGDFVRSRQNPNLTGQIIGERNFGDEYMVRLADGASTIWWHAIEIEHDPEAYPPQDAEQPLPDNVIPVDFTKGRALRPDTTTEGAA
ncbi:hypothetical protein CWR43_27940 [Rhizobium sullae]|uniref:Uncharacterized protein n=1 Tax=Rhizobium sullae TaxID=50338 RepID=A0A2N0D2R3_RHISU|nr:hypothetical protein [Rhizobium sullae]PKA40415.1 hypothetical protein CWR43_27940 [Rhizobium sullae]